MLFNSYIFIFAFLPLCVLGFYLIKRINVEAAKIWLIAFSLWFYGYFNLYYLAIMVGSVGINYCFYRLFERTSKRKALLAVAVTANLAVLFYFKYFDFFIENINLVFSKSFALRNILLPLGISFFTFQQISFLHDTYDGKVKDVKFTDYALFITFFPQLIAGPIVTADEMLPQFKDIGRSRFDAERFAGGVFIFVMGLAKKVIIADTFGKAVDFGYENVLSVTALEALLVVLFYTLQLYFDFSGYCDMAIGIGRLLGFEIALNFNSPYKACNIIDFWKRWHITLSRFFTRNIYIPLGGNRKGNFRMYLNLFIVFFLSGLWHGAGWNFILWGCMHGLLYVITRAWQKHKKPEKERNIPILKALNTLLTFAFVALAWVFFRAANVGEAVKLLSRIGEGTWTVGTQMAGLFNLGEFWYVLKILHISELAFGKYIIMVLFTVICCLIVFFAPNVHQLQAKMKFGTIHAIICGVVFIWCVVSLSGVGTFLYFNF